MTSHPVAAPSAPSDEAEAALSWALDIMDMYDQRLAKMDGEAKVLTPIHLQGKAKARRALETLRKSISAAAPASQQSEEPEENVCSDCGYRWTGQRPDCYECDDEPGQQSEEREALARECKHIAQHLLRMFPGTTTAQEQSAVLYRAAASLLRAEKPQGEPLFAVSVLLSKVEPPGQFVTSMTQSVRHAPDADAAKGAAVVWAMKQKPGFSVDDVLVFEVPPYAAPQPADALQRLRETVKRMRDIDDDNIEVLDNSFTALSWVIDEIDAIAADAIDAAAAQQEEGT